MNFTFDQTIASGYKSGSQVARVLTEDWMARNMFCPLCGALVLGHYGPNRPVADFFCENCRADFELKSKESKRAEIGNKVMDGAYGTMIERITSFSNPHLFVMTYADWAVNNLLLIPSNFFVPAIIEKRKPLAPTARRAGWVGCNISIGDVPESGRIFIIRKGRQEDRHRVIDLCQRALSLASNKLESRGWLLDVLKCVERVSGEEFCLGDVYAFADELQHLHPENNFVRAKIRQQLQVLRDKGFIQFVERGRYRKIIL